MSNISEYTDYLIAWSRFGELYSFFNENGFLHHDLNKGNIFYDSKKCVLVPIDCDDAIFIDYPIDWEEIPKDLMSLLRWLDIDCIAAFRFGYIKHGGLIAEIIFNLLRDKYGLYSRDTEGACSPLARYETSHIVEYYQSWKALRSMFPSKLIKNPKIFNQNQWKSEREKILGTLFNDSKKVRETFTSKFYHNKEQVDVLIDEYYYKEHLVLALRSGKFHKVFRGLNLLSGVYSSKRENFKASYLFLFCMELIIKYSDNIGKEEKTQYEDTEKQISKHIPTIDKKVLIQEDDVRNIFSLIWTLDDLEHGAVMKKDISTNAEET